MWVAPCPAAAVPLPARTGHPGAQESGALIARAKYNGGKGDKNMKKKRLAPINFGNNLTERSISVEIWQDFVGSPLISEQ